MENATTGRKFGRPRLQGAGAAAAPSSAATTKAKIAKVAPAISKFTAAGYVTAVGTDMLTITLDVKGGNQKAKAQSMTVSVPATAVVTRDGAAATLADLVAGDHVTIQGVKAGITYTASKVHVDSPAPPVVV